MFTENQHERIAHRHPSPVLGRFLSSCPGILAILRHPAGSTRSSSSVSAGISQGAALAFGKETQPVVAKKKRQNYEVPVVHIPRMLLESVAMSGT